MLPGASRRRGGGVLLPETKTWVTLKLVPKRNRSRVMAAVCGVPNLDYLWGLFSKGKRCGNQMLIDPQPRVL